MNRDSLNWIELKDLHESSIAKSMYIWFAIVPILANVISKIEITDTNFPIIREFLLALPFSMSILFLGALFMVVSNLTYHAWCPSILKDHKTFKSFMEDQKEMEHLIEYRDKAFALEQSFEAGWEDSEFEDTTHENIKQKFWQLHRRGKLSNPSQRKFSALCFYIALGCLALVALLNITSVLEQMW